MQMHQNEQIDKLLVSVGVGVGSFVVIIVVSVNYKTYIFKFVIGNFCVKIAIHQKQNISGYCVFPTGNQDVEFSKPFRQ